MKKVRSLWQLLLDWTLICLGVFGSLFCLISAFSVPYPDELWILIPVLALIFCLLFHENAGRYYALGVLMLLLLSVLLLRKELLESFRNLWGELAKRYALGYDQFMDYVPRKPTRIEDTLPALVCLAVWQTFLCSLAVRLWKRTLPAVLALLPGILPCFVLTDTPPALLPLLAAVFSVLTQSLSQSVRRRGTGEEGKAVVLSAAASAAILALLLLVFPEKTYAPPISWEELSIEMQHWGREQGNRGNLLAGLTGNPEEVDLAALGALPNRPYTVLYARSTADTYLYLRGSSYSEFDGTHWRRGTAEPLDKSCLFPYLQRNDGETLTLDTVEPEDLLYTTYQLTELPRNAEVVSDLYVRNSNNRKRYTMSFLSDLGDVNTTSQYASWVQAHNLALPGQTRQSVLSWWDAQGGEAPPKDLDSASAEQIEAFARKVAAAVSACAEYSRNPLPMPENVDFCTWFLNDAEEGYCVHYATVCTALLRALGIPARYVSGYVCGTPANQTVQVTNLQAHAWVEIWTGGRWVQIEPTPNDATEFTGLADYGWGRPANVGHTPETTAEDINQTTSPETTQSTVPDATPERPTRPSQESTGTAGANNSRGNAKPQNLTPVWVVLGVIGFLALTLSRRALALRLWENRLSRARGNEQARLLYRRMLRMEKHGGGTVPAEAVRLAKKAGFSQHTLTDEELQFLWQILNRQRGRLSRGSFWIKLYCKYILAII